MKNGNIKKILVPVDFTGTSEIAINEALTLGRLLKADIFFIHVVEKNESSFAVVPETQSILPSLLDLENAVEKKMEKMQDDIRKKFGITPEVFVTNGRVYSEVVNFAKKKKINLIIMGTHGASGYKEFFIGSNAQRVVTLSDVPVLTMQKKKKPGFTNILIPIDDSIHSREKVNIAMVIADLFGAKIHLIGLPDSIDKSDVDAIKKKLESVEKIIKADKLPYKSSVVKGKSLAKNAMTYAASNKCDLIVMNTGHESKTSGIFLGAFAQQIVNHSSIPVLSFKHTDGEYNIETPGFGI